MMDKLLTVVVVESQTQLNTVPFPDYIHSKCPRVPISRYASYLKAADVAPACPAARQCVIALWSSRVHVSEYLPLKVPGYLGTCLQPPHPVRHE
jgi:hypothetical protein